MRRDTTFRPVLKGFSLVPSPVASFPSRSETYSSAVLQNKSKLLIWLIIISHLILQLLYHSYMFEKRTSIWFTVLKTCHTPGPDWCGSVGWASSAKGKVTSLIPGRVCAGVAGSDPGRDKILPQSKRNYMTIIFPYFNDIYLIKAD